MLGECGVPFIVLLSDTMISVELRSVDAEELEQVLKLSLAVVCARHLVVWQVPERLLTVMIAGKQQLERRRHRVKAAADMNTYSRLNFRTFELKRKCVEIRVFFSKLKYVSRVRSEQL